MNWEQAHAILWLRWRLTRNQFVRGGTLNAIISFIVLSLVLVAAAGIGVGALALGASVLGKQRPEVLLFAWDGLIFVFLIFWLGGLMTEIQRSESIDLTKLLHLPVTLHRVFFFNYLASHLAVSLLICIPAMLGLCAGLVFSNGISMALLFPVVLTFVLMITAWTYCLRGWLVALMTNKRKRRAVIIYVTIAFVLLGQLPNLLIHSKFLRRGTRPSQPTAEGVSQPEQSVQAIPETFLQAHLAVPLGWIGYSAMSLKQANPWPAVGATLAASLLASLGLMRAYQMTIRFYQGAENQRKPRRRVEAAGTSRGPLLVERQIPYLKDDTAALALAFLRSMLRAPEVKMAMLMPFIVGAGLVLLQVSGPNSVPGGAFQAFAPTAAAIFAVFCLAPTMGNAFGLDRNGFRALVLLPTPRKEILFAKNLSFAPLVAVIGVVLLAVLGFWLKISWSDQIAGLLQLTTAFLMFSLSCNMTSILAPFRFAAGTLQAKKPKALVFLFGILNTMLLPLIALPIVISPLSQLLFKRSGWLPGFPINLLCSLLMLGLVVWLYSQVIPFQGRLLYRREKDILRDVTEEIE